MAANVETMFYTREKPWHGLGGESGRGFKLSREFERLRRVKMPDSKVDGCINVLLPMDASMSTQQKNNITRLREDMEMRYFEAPDLQDMTRNACRFINAMSDFATRGPPEGVQEL